jgi:hypothetical protein
MANKILNSYEDNGYVLIKNFIKSDDFNLICENFKKDTLIEFNKLEKNIGGNLMGNLNIYPGTYGKNIFDILDKKKLNDLIEKITKKKFHDFDIISGGNLNFQFKFNQHFHTDSKFHNSFLIINIATENIDEKNGPLELVPGTHKTKLPYWKFIFKKPKKKISMERGDILIRTSNLWHRGTKNSSKESRLLLNFILKDKINEKPNYDFLNNNKLQIFNNLFKSNILGSIRENFYTRLSYFYVLFRLIRSFFSDKHFH